MDCWQNADNYTIEQDPDSALPFSVQWYEFLRGADSYWTRRRFVRPGETYTPSKDSLNGHRYRATTGGTTGLHEPLWPIGMAATVIDSGVIWKEIGREDTIAPGGSTWDAGGLTLSDPAVDDSGCVATATLAGLTAGARYTVTNSILSVQGKKQDQSFDVIAKSN